LSKLQRFKEMRRDLFAKYVDVFSDLAELVLPKERDYVSSNWHLFPVRVPKHKRLQIFQDLRSAQIGVQVNYLPAYRHPAFSGQQIDPSDYPNSESFYSSEISLPMHASITEKEFEYISSSLRNIMLR